MGRISKLPTGLPHGFDESLTRFVNGTPLCGACAFCGMIDGLEHHRLSECALKQVVVTQEIKT